ncbi:MAG TPA: polyprenyl diphosphate synthase [Candidatus Pacearchaeota archaeon]|nr:polyprenyl diphosphate synthase [Candidatus Pacearchaeota archaeon]HOL90408.1 polyprenyl diphosphate synthase [Candidatus Pacearchaeota archaeon]HPO68578.1 polyprenyl diphosphate synthase [Candidatus Pacearchaeota archaeon]
MKEKTINHLGIIIDGNRRWAKKRGLPTFEGHKKGIDKVKKAIEWANKRGIKNLTFFVFSTENWKRSKKEVDYLMKLAEEMIKDYEDTAKKEKIRIRVIGQKEKLPKSLQKEIEKVENSTKNNKKMTVNFALSYGGRNEIVEVVKKIIEKKIPLEKINEKTISQNLWTTDLDLLIRTGKEKRLSNFLLWQSAYSELYFSSKYWPDFTEKDLEKALNDYYSRQRRFGK